MAPLLVQGCEITPFFDSVAIPLHSSCAVATYQEDISSPEGSREARSTPFFSNFAFSGDRETLLVCVKLEESELCVAIFELEKQGPGHLAAHPSLICIIVSFTTAIELNFTFLSP